MSIFEQIGGDSAVAAVVDDFYRRVLGDPELAPFFDSVDLRRLQTHQRSFLAAAIGRPEPYLGCPMREVHARFNIKPAHFDRTADHLVDTLSELGVPDLAIEEIVATLATLREEIAPGASARAS